MLFIDIALEVGRVANLFFGQTLKAIGDSIIPAIFAVAINLVVVVCGAYLSIIVLKIGVTVIFIALALDKYIRFTIMFVRWRSGDWEKKVFIKHNPQIEG